MLIWTPADGRRGTPDFETDALSDGFAESASSETPDTTPCGPTCADVFMVTHGAADKPARKAEDDVWCAVDRPAETRDRVKCRS